MPRSTYQRVRSSIQYWCHVLVGARLDEELHLHLLELPGAEDEVARGDLVAERLADLADAERRLLAGRLHHVGEVDEDALRGLRPQVVQAGLVLDRAEVGLEHHVEHRAARSTGRGCRSAGRATSSRHRVGRTSPCARRNSSCRWSARNRLWQDLHSISGSTEHPDVAGGHATPAWAGSPRSPGRRCPRGAVTIARHHCFLMFSLSSTPERSVVPGRPGAAVDLPGGKDEPPPLAEADHIVETAGRSHVDLLQDIRVRPIPGWDGVSAPGYRPPTCQKLSESGLAEFLTSRGEGEDRPIS